MCPLSSAVFRDWDLHAMLQTAKGSVHYSAPSCQENATRQWPLKLKHFQNSQISLESYEKQNHVSLQVLSLLQRILFVFLESAPCQVFALGGKVSIGHLQKDPALAELQTWHGSWSCCLALACRKEASVCQLCTVSWILGSSPKQPHRQQMMWHLESQYLVQMQDVFHACDCPSMLYFLDKLPVSWWLYLKSLCIASARHCTTVSQDARGQELWQRFSQH